MKPRVGHILSLSATFICIGNVFQGIFDHQDTLYYLLHVAPFFLFGTIVLWVPHPKKELVANLFMILAWAGAWLGEEGNLTPAIFIMFALYVDVSDWRLTATLAGVIIVTVAKFVFAEYTVAQFFTYNSGYVFALGFYWYYIHPGGPGGFAPIEGHPIDEINLRILHFMAEGKTRREIADRVFLSYDAVNKRMERLREAMEFETVEVMMYRLTVAGVIPSSLPADFDGDEGVSENGNLCPDGDIDAQE